ncbi:NAD(P)/FAD-dependent oxidoreductase [Arenibacter sp. M-2]|uniref:NAD(P)/FAD-dependent oxidoreductase n=1 Tax=Arenibacter sp. M-2 TaxID=3053612 RepID=UPI00257053BC|nr:NAD(P)/FAD-dependent oxidoreductase [Arenibacter sp. M-2]MDL5512819.1 NAD(P)/FAD-dependent oxidoreductase [Arenibacter sp. M-2]|tara:strand:+ start:10816 stop:11937 length:1122 start_codon:yes stop_codon:yes gene_type:complete
MDNFDVIIVGGGLAGLTAAIHLRKENYSVAIIESRQYPHHKVCGEYISHEVKPYLEFLGITLPQTFQFNEILLSIEKGKALKAKLPLGGFGLSRYILDHLLYQRSLALGSFVFNDSVTAIDYENDNFRVLLASGKEYKSKFVIGAYGKRAGLDKELQRQFIEKKSPWLAVKAHYKLDSFPDNLVAVHNFRGGYGGLSKTESGAVNFCYLVSYDSFKKEKDIANFNQNVIAKNPYLGKFLNEAEMLFENPLTIGQISFHKKKPVENHIIMCGDTAGLIHPLCGNGMAMAIHSAKIASESIHGYFKNGGNDRLQLESDYETQWKHTFAKRLWLGRQLQAVMLSPKLSNLAMGILTNSPYIVDKMIKRTHGQIIQC